MTVGFFAPLPPARTGVADHAAHLLTILRAAGAVEVQPQRAGINLYHLGNNLLHVEIYRNALRTPGVIVLHDAVLHHFLLGLLSRDEYIEEFVFNYGEQNRASGIALWRDRATSAADERYFAHPMLRRICAASRAIIVHNPAAAKMVLAHVPEARVVEIPLLWFEDPEPGTAETEATRRALGVDPDEMLCGLFGHLRESKRVRVVAEACAEAGVRLLAAGECASDLERALRPALSQPFVIRRGYTPPAEFRNLACAVDVCANLRYPSAGETSAISIRLMAAGKPVLLTASEENSRYPADGCLRIEPGLPEKAHLVEALVWLRRSPIYGREIGERAAAYIHREHASARVAESYWNVLRSA